MMTPFVIGVSGVTNGGKSMLTCKLKEIITHSSRMCQDDYFLPVDSPLHVPCGGSVNHHNWDVITSINMNSMVRDVHKLLKEQTTTSPCVNPVKMSQVYSNSDASSLEAPLLNLSKKVVLLDGFRLFDDPKITELCDLRIFMTLSKEECIRRRLQREYEPPDPLGYFDVCVWPMHKAYLERVKKIEDVTYFDGSMSPEYILHATLKSISKGMIE